MGDRKQTDIYIVRTGKGFVVRPAAAVVSRSRGSLQFVNLTRGKALVHLPARELGNWQRVIEVPPESGKPGHCDPIQLPGDVPYGAYSYSVYSEEARDYCQGESSPIIIIDD